MNSTFKSDELVLQASGLLQSNKLVDDSVERQNCSPRFRTSIITVTNVDWARIQFFLADHFEKIHLETVECRRKNNEDVPKMKLYCAISPLRIFFGRVLSPLSTSAKRPREFRRSTILAAYSFCYPFCQNCWKNLRSESYAHKEQQQELRRLDVEKARKAIFRQSAR